MEYSFKNIHSLDRTIDEMKEDVFDNINTLNKLLSEVKKLRLGTEETIIEKSSINQIEENDKVAIANLDEEENSLLEEIIYYYLKVKDFNITENKKSIEELQKELPSVKKTNYQDIILGINSFFIKEINEIKVFIENEKNNIAKEELDEFKKDIIDIQLKINTILQISQTKSLQKETNEIEQEQVNKIVFLETESGNIYVQEDLDNNSVPSEYYEGFAELIHSIEDGTFKNVRYLTNNNKIVGIGEVRGTRKRVIFDRVGYDTYAIIGAFIKKSNKDKSYLDPLINRIVTYKKNKDNIVKKVKEPTYLESQKEILKQIYALLEPIQKKRG